MACEFDELHASYNHLLNRYEKQRKYLELLQLILEYYEINYPKYEYLDEVEF